VRGEGYARLLLESRGGKPRERPGVLNVFLAIIIGFVSAVLAGMFGIGGAAVTTPSLRLILDTTPGIALGTTLPVTIPTAAVSAFTYWRRGLVNRRVAGICCATGVVGATGGALATRYLNLHYLMLVTGAMVIYVSAMTLRRGIAGHGVAPDLDEVAPREVRTEAPGEVACDTVPSIVLASGIGFVAGIFSGLLGVGGGVLLIPGFLYLLRMPLRRAFATSLAVIVVIAIPGTIVHSFLHHISWTLVLYLVIGSIPGAYLGARLNLRTAERTLYMMFGALLGAFGVIFIVNEIITMVR
jgi:uncharacterized membrane protein YfcA